MKIIFLFRCIIGFDLLQTVDELYRVAEEIIGKTKAKRMKNLLSTWLHSDGPGNSPGLRHYTLISVRWNPAMIDEHKV